MMFKHLIFCSLLLFTSLIYSQFEKLEEFTASNGVTYKIGDEITLNRGSDNNGKFVYVTIGGIGWSTNPEENRLTAYSAGLIVTIKKIKKYNKRRFKGVIFTVGAGDLTNYLIDIENAIKSCEIVDCKKDKGEVAMAETLSKFDKLKELKSLLDEGILTEEEYNSEKKKILERNY